MIWYLVNAGEFASICSKLGLILSKISKGITSLCRIVIY